MSRNRRSGRDHFDRIAADGSQKLLIRIVPVLRSERGAGRLPAGAMRVLAAWICQLRGLGAPVNDARSEGVVPLADAVPQVLDRLDQVWAAPPHWSPSSVEPCRQLTGQARARRTAWRGRFPVHANQSLKTVRGVVTTRA